jgi:carbamoyltransferase
MDVKDKSSFESVTHIDGTTRPQTVKDGVFAELLYEVKKLIGHSLILNTSLNVNGKPITTPENAKNIKGLNALFIGNDYV